MPRLWEPYDIPIVGLAGEADSGKTMWGLMASPDCLNFDVPAPTLIWDTEGSSAPYVGTLNFDRVDLPTEAAKQSSKYSNLDIFTRWREHAQQLEPGRYQICILDAVSEIEDGLVTYVRAHPGEFGYTSNQFAKMESLLWVAVKAEWKRLLMDIARKCETLVLTMHMMYEWKGRVTTNRRVPKGKETIKHVTSLYLLLYRKVKPGVRNAACEPSAFYEKSRLVRINPETKKPEPLLPPHIVNASPDGIREYLKTPPNFNHLELNERARPEQVMSDDDRLAVKVNIALEENARAQADLSRTELEREVRNEVAIKSIESSEVRAVKARLLKAMSLDEAKVLLHRYSVGKVSELNSQQLTDLNKHIDSLGN